MAEGNRPKQMATDRAKEAFAAFAQEHGRPPEAWELAERMVIGEQYAGELIRRAGLPHRTSNTKVTPERMREAHTKLTERDGKPPLAIDVAAELGVSRATAGRWLRTMDLPYRCKEPEKKPPGEPRRAPQEDAPARTWPARKRRLSEAQREAQAMEELHSVLSKRKMRMMELQNSGDPEKRPKKLPSPGDGYGPSERIFTTCAICGEKIFIAPRMHPWWVRNREGAVLWICGPKCYVQE